MFFLGFNLSQRIFFNKVEGTAYAHPLKLNIYTLAPISFKPFAYSKLNITCNYKKSLIFNGSLRKTRYNILTKKITSISYSCLLQLPTLCQKQKKIPCTHSIRVTLNEESHNLQFLAPK